MFDYSKYIGVTPDFPKPGISFKDISPLLKDPVAFRHCIDDIAEMIRPYNPTCIISIESRGFLFASALSYKLGIGNVMARKAGKLPGHNLKVDYALEYGTASLEIRDNVFTKDDRVVLIDDLIATGGSFRACEDLVRLSGATPVCAVAIIRLEELEGEKALSIPLHYLLNLSDSH